MNDDHSYSVSTHNSSTIDPLEYFQKLHDLGISLKNLNLFHSPKLINFGNIMKMFFLRVWTKNVCSGRLIT